MSKTRGVKENITKQTTVQQFKKFTVQVYKRYQSGFLFK